MPRSRRWPCLLLLCVVLAPSLSTAVFPLSPDPGHVKRQTSSEPPLVDFQVSEPILTPLGTTDRYGCIYTQLLMEHDFAFSYGKPFVGE